MKFSFPTFVFIVSMVAIPYPSQAQSAQPHTEAAVIAVDQAWSVAEEKGDVGYVDNLLLPEYRSVSPNGSIHDKTAILANTKHATPEHAAMIEKYIKDHPTDMAVVINGDVAVLTFTPKSDTKQLISSCDIFVFRNSQWHAIYSQHTTAEVA